MSEQLWTGLPFVTQPNKDDELLLVNGEEQSRRITVQNLVYSQLAEVAWVVDSAANQGIGTANQWGNIPFNQLNAPNWLSLNADGSFVVAPGIYLLDAGIQIGSVDRASFRLFDGANSIFQINPLLQAFGVHHFWVPLRTKLNLLSEKTLQIQVNVQTTASNAFLSSASPFPGGGNVTISQAFIWRLG
jgi:hypothetical protein